MYAGAETFSNDFSGGLKSNTAVTEVPINTALDLSNLVIGPKGNFFRSRYGDTEFNATAMNSSAAVQGLSYFKLDSGTDYLVTVCGNKLYSSASSLGGTMTDITGALTITSNQDNLWTQFTFNNVHLGFGGSPTSPDVPWSWSGSGNAAALAGTPPSAYGAFQVNNRVFAYRTAANPSRIGWCVIGNQADWTGAGSGTADVWTSDNDSLTSHAILGNGIVLLFKENSIHKMFVNNFVSGAFPITPAFADVGCAGKHACVVADGLAYFITSQGRMAITDGNQIFDTEELPHLSDIDDLWTNTNQSRLKFITGKRVVGPDYDHIWWAVSSTAATTTNDWKFVWDLDNECWLRDKTGYAVNAVCTTQAGTPYAGGYAGKIYKKDVSTATTDASNTATQIDSYWTSGWLKEGSLEKVKQPRKATLSFVSQTTGTIEFSWGFDFSSFARTYSQSQKTSAGIWGQSLWGQFTWGGATDLLRPVRITGRGNVFQFRIRNRDSKMKINSINFSGKTQGQKELSAR